MKVLYNLFLLFIFSQSFSQDTIFYFNRDWEETVKDSAWFYRISKANYGVFHGKVVNYYKSGKVQMTGHYVNGKQQGEFVWFYENGRPKEKGRYNYGKFTITGAWDSLGNVQVEDGSGCRINYYDNCNKRKECNYKNGKPEGKYTMWYRNGQKQEEMEYVNGYPTHLNCWDRMGEQMVVEGNGKYKSFYTNGKMSVIGKYNNGRKQGMWKWYYENGKLKQRGRYSNGKKDGQWIYNYNNGRIWGVDSFTNGKLINYKFYPAKGQKEVIVFEDTFDDKIYNWDDIDNDSTVIKFGNGNYTMSNKCNYSSLTSGVYAPINENGNFRIKASISLDSTIERLGYGICWGGLDPWNFYSAIITVNGDYKIFFKDGNRNKTIVDWSKFKYESKSNVLEIAKIGDIVYFYINGEFICKFTHLPLLGSFIGITTSKGITISVDYLKISEW